MLNHSQIKLLLLFKKREGNLFCKLPIELIRKELIEHSQDPHSDFAKTLNHVARGEMQAAKAMLDKNPRFVLQSGNVVTRAGLVVNCKTPLECALGEGDAEMAEMIISYFSKFEGGEAAKESQLERYQPLIKNMLNQDHYNLTELIEIIKNSSAIDITAALNKNMDHASKVRDALIEFRKAVDPRDINKPRMHYNYQTLIHAFNIYDSQWSSLFQASENNLDKCELVWRQVIGYLQRSLPAFDRFAFANGLSDLVALNISVKRTTDYKYGTGSFPDTSTDASCSGLGFDYALGGRAAGSALRGGCAGLFQTYLQQKLMDLLNLCNSSQNKLSHEPLKLN